MYTQTYTYSYYIKDLGTLIDIKQKKEKIGQRYEDEVKRFGGGGVGKP